MPSILSLNDRYAGLFYTARQIGHHFIKSKTMMFSNKPLEIQIPQIIDYV